MLDLTDAELDVKCKYCNDLLTILDLLNCGDCKKRGKFFFKQSNLEFLYFSLYINKII